MPTIRTTVGRLMVNDALPPDVRDYSRQLDKKELAGLLRDIALRHPDQYRRISKRLSDIGWLTAYRSGGFSFGLRHLQRSEKAKRERERLQRELAKVYADPRLSDEEKDKRVLLLVGKLAETQEEDVFREQMAKGNPLALQVLSGARGNKMNLSSLLASDLLYTDHRGRVIPFPVLRSYSQGLSPAEYWAGAYGARKGVVDLKEATRDAGYLCLAEGTEVRMADWSVRRIEDIRPGDQVLGADKNGNTFPVRVTNVFHNGPREVFTYAFREYESRSARLYITCTPQHKVLGRHVIRRETHGRSEEVTEVKVIDDVIPIGDMRPNTVWHTYKLVPLQGHTDDYGEHEPLAWELGIVFSRLIRLNDDGIVIRTGTSGSPPDAIRDRLERNHFALHRMPKRKTEYMILDDSGRGGHRLRDKLHQLGITRAEQTLELPREVFRWDNASVARLLNGLFFHPTMNVLRDYTPRVSLWMRTEKIAYQAADLLRWRFGIRSSVVSRYPAKSNHRWWYVAIIGADPLRRFKEAVSGFSEEKQAKFEQHLETVENASQRRSYYAHHYLSSTPAGVQETYDIEVDHPDHLFVLACGAIVSNSKQLNQIVHRGLVTAIDRDDDEDAPEKYDPEAPLFAVRGMPADVDDADNEGALLARPAGGYKRNTILTPAILRDLRRKGIKRILVRSPIVGGPADGGVYARDVGVREFGRLPTIGENVSLAAVQALSEPITQSSISSKHSGGVATASAAKSISGFEAINQLVQVPRVFKGGASHAEVDGIVQRVVESPAGGFHVIINNQPHYVPPDRKIQVSRGDRVEAGDVLSDGLPNPAIVVKHKGIGEGRRYFVQAFRDAVRNAGLKAHRRNVELLARGLINHVRLTEEAGNHVPGDVVIYDALEHTYKPRQDAQRLRPRDAVGKYLERPVLHYTIGTPVRPSVARQLEEFGIKSITTHAEPPPFEPEMIRGAANLVYDPDWRVRMYGSSLRKSLLQGVWSPSFGGAPATSFVPGLAEATHFGREGKVRTPQHAPPDASLFSPPEPAGSEKQAAGNDLIEQLRERVRRRKWTKAAQREAAIEQLRAGLQQTPRQKQAQMPIMPLSAPTLEWSPVPKPEDFGEENPFTALRRQEEEQLRRAAESAHPEDAEYFSNPVELPGYRLNEEQLNALLSGAAPFRLYDDAATRQLGEFLHPLYPTGRISPLLAVYGIPSPKSGPLYDAPGQGAEYADPREAFTQQAREALRMQNMLLPVPPEYVDRYFPAKPTHWTIQLLENIHGDTYRQQQKIRQRNWLERMRRAGARWARERDYMLPLPDPSSPLYPRVKAYNDSLARGVQNPVEARRILSMLTHAQASGNQVFPQNTDMRRLLPMLRQSGAWVPESAVRMGQLGGDPSQYWDQLSEAGRIDLIQQNRLNRWADRVAKRHAGLFQAVAGTDPERRHVWQDAVNDISQAVRDGTLDARNAEWLLERTSQYVADPGMPLREVQQFAQRELGRLRGNAPVDFRQLAAWERPPTHEFDLLPELLPEPDKIVWTQRAPVQSVQTYFQQPNQQQLAQQSAPRPAPQPAQPQLAQQPARQPVSPPIRPQFTPANPAGPLPATLVRQPTGSYTPGKSLLPYVMQFKDYIAPALRPLGPAAAPLMLFAADPRAATTLFKPPAKRKLNIPSKPVASKLPLNKPPAG